MTRSQRKALLEGGNVARRSYLWSAGKPKRYTAWESLGICPRPGTAQNIFLIITCMNRKFASYSCKWYQAGRDFKYFGGWAGTSKQSWRIREIAWEKKKKNRLQFSRNKGKTCCLCKNSWAAEHSTGRERGRGRQRRQRILAWTWAVFLTLLEKQQTDRQGHGTVTCRTRGVMI